MLLTEKVKKLPIQVLYINNEGMSREEYLDITHSAKTPTAHQIKNNYKTVYTLDIESPIPGKVHLSICNTIFANFQQADSIIKYQPFIDLKIRSMMIGDIVQIDDSQYMVANGFDWKLIT